MKVIYKILIAIIFVSAVLFFLFNHFKNNSSINLLNVQVANPVSDTPNIQSANVSASSTDLVASITTENGFRSPLDRAKERVTKKPFGIFITKQTSPVQPEKFSGYHTGTDFEIFPDELNADVPVHAVCSGKLATKKYATGYGGVAVENCNLNGQSITVVYGHLRLISISAPLGANLSAGDTIGVLGAAYSSETNGERKHLHLGFHKGSSINILGYVPNKSELSGWVDPCLYICE